MTPAKRRRVGDSPGTLQRDLPTWEDIFTNYAIFERIFTHLDPGGIMALRATTKQLVRSIDCLSKVQWNINSSLRRFVDNPVGFRSLMGRHDALISGGFALQFFDRAIWKESDLDIYVDASLRGDQKGAVALGRHLMENERYVHQKTTPQANHAYRARMEHIELISTFIRKDLHGNETKIQIMSTEGAPLVSILSSFYTTALVNFISWDCAFSVFPELTFIMRETYQLKTLDEYYDHHLEKYRRRGWETLEILGDEDTEWTKSLQLAGYRYVGDSNSWKMRLDTTNVESGLPSSVLEYSQFSMAKEPGSQSPSYHGYITRPHYMIGTRNFESSVLRHKYTWAGSIGSGSVWGDTLGPRLFDMTSAELVKLNEDQRPFQILPQYDYESTRPQYEHHYYQHTDAVRRNPPPGWKFYDELVPEWFEAYRVGKDAKEAAKELETQVTEVGD